MKKRKAKMSLLSKKVSEKTGLGMYEADAILRVAAYDLIEILKKEQRFYWKGLGVFRVRIIGKEMYLQVKLEDESYKRLNKKDGEVNDEIIFD